LPVYILKDLRKLNCFSGRLPYLGKRKRQKEIKNFPEITWFYYINKPGDPESLAIYLTRFNTPSTGCP
jgi:hypothetical protein